MTDVTMKQNVTKEDVLSFDVSDEALESAAGVDQKTVAYYTLGSCTGVSVCPGW